MENYYRGKSRAIALIDIIWSSIGLFSTTLTFFGLAIMSQTERNEFKRTQLLTSELNVDSNGQNNDVYFTPNSRRPQDSMYSQVNMMANVMLGAVMIAMAINTVQLIAAIRLLKACDVEMDSNKSIKSCRFWCCTTIFFVVLLALHLFTPGRVSVPGQIFSMAQILFRALGLYYVSEFIKEMAHGPILPVNVGPGVGGGISAATANSFLNSSNLNPHNHTMNIHQQTPRGAFFPKPSPGGYPTEEEPPPPYTASEAPPPYEHVQKI